MNVFPLLAQAGDSPDPAVESPAPPAESTDTTTQVPGDTPPPGGGVQDPPGWMSPMVPLIVGIVILYFFVFRSKKTQDRKRTDMLANLKKGDTVQTIGGIIGKVLEARESDVLVKVDESSNTKIRFSRSAIHRVLTDEKADAK